MTRVYYPEGINGNGENRDNTDTIADMLNDHKDIHAAIEVIMLMKKLLGGENETNEEYVNEISKGPGI